MRPPEELSGSRRRKRISAEHERKNDDDRGGYFEIVRWTERIQRYDDRQEREKEQHRFRVAERQCKRPEKEPRVAL